IRMSRNFGMKMLTMTNLSTECLIQLTKLGYDATPFNQILKQNAKREMRLRLGKVTVADVLARSEERFSRNAETDLVCRLLLEKKKNNTAREKIVKEDVSRIDELEQNVAIASRRCHVR